MTRIAEKKISIRYWFIKSLPVAMFCFSTWAVNAQLDWSIIKQLFGLEVRNHYYAPHFRIRPGFPHSIDLIP